MVTVAEIEAALTLQMPAALAGDVHALAAMMAGVANGEITTAEAETRLAGMNAFLEKLSGRKVQGPLISIGGDLGGRDVTVGDVAGGAILKINLQTGGLVINLNPAIPEATLVPPVPRRILLCHPPGEPTLEPLVTGLLDRLESKAIIVKPDQELLQPGKEWQLFAWLGLAHVAIVLLTPSALQSDWMLRECQILTGRLLLEEELILIPVLLGSLTAADLTAGDWSGLDLEKQNPISGLAGDALVQAIVARITAVERPAETSLEKVERQIVALFEGANTKALENAARELGLDATMGLAGQRLPDALAGAIWYADVLKWETTLHELSIDSNVRAAQVAEWMLPSWVNPCAARGLVDAARPNTSLRAVAINGQQPAFVGETFVRRAFFLPPNHRRPVVVVDTVIDGRPMQAHVREIREALKEKVLGDRFLSDDDFVPDLQDELAKWPVFVIVPPPIPPQPELDELLAAFPWPGLTFFLLLQPEEKEAAARLSRVLLLRPPLQDREEHRALRQYNRIRQ